MANTSPVRAGIAQTESRVFLLPKRGDKTVPFEKRTVILRLAINLFVFIYGNAAPRYAGFNELRSGKASFHGK